MCEALYKDGVKADRMRLGAQRKKAIGEPCNARVDDKRAAGKKPNG